MRALASLIVAAGLGFAPLAATAMPVANLKADSAVTDVRYGCGPGMTRGPAGMCRPRFTCPPGWHPGPHGWHCFRNW